MTPKMKWPLGRTLVRPYYLCPSRPSIWHHVLSVLYCHRLSLCLISTYLNIYVLYIVNLVSKDSVPWHSKMQEKGTCWPCSKKMFVLLISVCQYCSVNMVVWRITVQRFPVYIDSSLCCIVREPLCCSKKFNKLVERESTGSKELCECNGWCFRKKLRKEKCGPSRLDRFKYVQMMLFTKNDEMKRKTTVK